jgi:UDP-N-acetylmuramyl pentapeptide phosphotransferase/UDP-N-acetylglucosamine-1-phosphate transferase
MILSIILSLILTVLIIRNRIFLGKKSSLIDIPNKNKIHEVPVYLFGGPIIFLILLIFLIEQFDMAIFYSYQFLYIFSFFILGLIDDKINLNSGYKILFVVLFSSTLIIYDESFLIHKIFLDISNNEFYFGKLKIPVTLFCILLLYIAMNMSDGINCLLITFSILTIFILNIMIFNSTISLFDIAILFSLIILFYLNYKNIIFLGNSGASLLASYFIYKLISTNYFSQIDVFEVISIFIIMGIDMVRLVIIRIFKQKNPFDRDLNHFHHLLLKKNNLFLTVIFYLILSFGPIILSYIMDIQTVYLMPFPIIVYFYLVNKLS